MQIVAWQEELDFTGTNALLYRRVIHEIINRARAAGRSPQQVCISLPHMAFQRGCPFTRLFRVSCAILVFCRGIMHHLSPDSRRASLQGSEGMPGHSVLVHAGI